MRNSSDIQERKKLQINLKIKSGMPSLDECDDGCMLDVTEVVKQEWGELNDNKKHCSLLVELRYNPVLSVR